MSGYEEMLQIERELQEEAWREDGELQMARIYAEREWVMEVTGELTLERERADKLKEDEIPVVQASFPVIEDDDIPF